MIDPLRPDYSNTPASLARPPFDYIPVAADERPCISIVTPFYNTDMLFHETALSLKRQSLQQWEWIIVNDGSSNPDSIRLLQNYREGDPRIRVIDHPENKGLPAARNTGVREAHSDYIALLDSDDLLEPTALEKWTWFLECRPECSFVSGYSVGFGATHYLWPDGFHSGRKFLQKNMVNSTSAVRKATHQTVGGYSEDMRGGLEDWEFWLRCADRGFWGESIPEYLDWYRRRHDHGDRWENLDIAGKHESACRKIRSRYAHLETSFPTTHPSSTGIYPRVPEAIPFRNRLGKSKKRLLMLIPWMTMGGADKFNLDLVSQLLARHWEITIVATLAGDNSWYPQFASKTPDIFILDHFLPLTDWPRFICYLMSSRQIDQVWIGNSEFGYTVLPYLKQQFPSVAYTDFCHMEEEYWKDGGYPRRAVESQPLLDLNVVSSQHLKDWMVQRGAEPERIRVCYTNVDSLEWSPQPAVREAVRKEYAIAENVPVILYAGRIHAQKQPKVFAETVRRLRKSEESFAVIAAGDGPEFQWLRGFLIEHQLESCVKLLGAVPNEQMKRLLQASDIFFLPSMMEGISLAIYEAMSCGIAVIGADVGGQKELVTPDCGFLIPRDSESTEAETYTSVISGLLKNPAKMRAMGRAGRRRVGQFFRLQDMGKRMDELFSSAEYLSRTCPRLPINPGLGRSILSMAIDYNRIERLLRELYPYYSWTQRNRANLKDLFPADKLPPIPAHFGSAQIHPDADTETGELSTLLHIEESIYNLFAHIPERVLDAYLGGDVAPCSPLLQDLLKMRNRILPQIARWAEQQKRIAIYGIGTHTQAMLGSIPALMPLVHCFIDKQAKGTYLGRICVKPQMVHESEFDVVIYSSKRWERDMYSNLAHIGSIEHVLIYSMPNAEHTFSLFPGARLQQKTVQ